MKRAIQFVLVVISLNSCNGFKNNSKTTTSIDTVFYSTGIVESITEIKNDQRNGWRFEYDSNGILTKKGFYVDGEVNGEMIDYYADGNLRSKSRWLKNKVFGDVIIFYPNGIIKQYSCYDFKEHCRYREQFDTCGNLISRKGILVGQLLSEKAFDSLYLSDPQTVHICVAKPPNTIQKFSVILLDSENKVLDYKEPPDSNNIISITRLFFKPGSYTQLAIGTLYDSSYNTLKVDTLISVFNLRTH